MRPMRVGIPTDDLSIAYFRSDNVERLQKRIHDEIKRMIGYDIKKISKINMYVFMRKTYFNAINYIYSTKSLNATIESRLISVNNLLVNNAVRSILWDIQSSLSSLELRNRIQTKPYITEQMYQRHNNKSMMTYRGDGSDLGYSTGIRQRTNRRKNKLNGIITSLNTTGRSYIGTSNVSSRHGSKILIPRRNK